MSMMPELHTQPQPRLRSRVFNSLTGEYFWLYLLLVPSILILIGVVIIPILFAFRMSLGNTNIVILGGKGTITNSWVGLQNYFSLFQNSLFWQSFRETLYYWLVVTANE